jgi:hypothetical protein
MGSEKVSNNYLNDLISELNCKVSTRFDPSGSVRVKIVDDKNNTHIMYGIDPDELYYRLFNYLKNSKYSGIRSQTNYGNSNIKL